MSRYYVVDAGVLFSTWAVNILDAKLATTSNILTEIRNRSSQARAEILTLLDRMRIEDPLQEHLKQVRLVASRSGDISVISENDIELIALALMLNEGGNLVTLVSMDLAVLNTASHLNLRTLDPTGKFGQKITWVMRCPACSYKSKTMKRETECPVCGTKLRRTPLKKRRIC